MSFDYSTLKQITTEGIVDGTIISSNIANNTITGTQIGSNQVSSSNLASGSVVLGSSTVTGSVGIGSGGTGRSDLGSAYNALVSNGSSLYWAPYGIYGMQVFTSSGTWNRPSNVRYIKIQCVGSGGGGSGHGESGGSGGYSERVLEVLQNGIGSVSVTINGPGGGTYYSGAGGGGSGVSFGPYCSASGGYGANQNNQHSGGLAGSGSGGDLNIYGGGGQTHNNRSSVGGDCFWGGAVAAGHPQGGNFSHNHQGHATPGSGGSGAYFGGHRGSDGKQGMIVITMYY